MGDRSHLRWHHRPQLFVTAVVAGLLLALGGARGLSARSILQPASQQGQSVIRNIAPGKPKPHTDCAVQACIALTFDDGPNPETTPQILDILEQEDARATFFVVGTQVKGHEAILRRMYVEGHEIGNHSWNHPNLTKLSAQQISDQVLSTQAAIIGAEVPAPTLFRPPYGAVDSKVRSNVPLTIALWNVDPLDWKSDNPEELQRIIIEQAKAGGVIDLHDIYPSTVSILRTVIQTLEPHYQFVTFSEMMDIPPGQPGLYYGRK